MPGIIFLKTQNLEKISSFYENDLGMKLWLDQGACKIFKKENLLLGFCSGDGVDDSGVITFFFETKKEVDEIYKRTSMEKLSKPVVNEQFKIYNFFAKDPEGRTLEFQAFLHDIKWDFAKER